MKFRHAYLPPGIDQDTVHLQARGRMTDYRSKESTVVHHHREAEPCKDTEHTVYDHRDESVTEKVYVEDGYATWRQPDPLVKK